MAEVTKPIKIGNVWTNLISGATGESVNFEEVTEWVDGTPMDDSKADGIIYRKLPDSVGGGYVKRVYSGPIQGSWLSLDNTGSTNNSSIINKYILIDDIELDNGTYLANLTISGHRLIGKDSTTVLSSPFASDSSVITVNNSGKIENISVDGNGVAARGVSISSGGRFEITNIKVSNLLGSTTQSMGIFINSQTNYKIVLIRGCEISDITGEAPSGGGSISRGIRVDGNCLVRIEDCVFREVGTFEDGDCIAIQTTQDVEEGTGWTPTNVIIDNCEFYNIKKRAVKIQASGVTVKNCRVYSSYVDYTECPGNAFDLFGGNNKLLNNYVELDRAVSGIRVSGGDNTIKGNIVYVDKTGTYRTEGTSAGSTICGLLLGVSPANVDTPINNTIEGNTIQGSVMAVYHTSSHYTTFINNKCYGAVVILSGSTNVLVKDNSVYKQSFVSLLYGIQVRDSSTQNVVVLNNVVYNPSWGIGLGETTSDEANNWVLHNNTVISPTQGDYRYLVQNVASSNKFGAAQKDFGISGVIRDSTSGVDADSLTPDRVEILSTQLLNTPSTAGITFWRIETQRVYPKTTTEFYIQTAIAVQGSTLNTNPHIKFQRYFSGSAWTDWVKSVTSFDTEYQAELTTTSLNLATTVRYRWLNIDTDTTLTLTGTTTGRRTTTIKVINTDSSEHTFTLSPSLGYPGGVAIPANSTRTFTIEIINGAARAYLQDARISTSVDSANPVSSSYNQAEVQAILDELRDLKTKMRAAGLLAT